MQDMRQLGDLDLAALISSRICHDAIGPVGAISNGLEVLDDDPDDSMREFALDTIRKSATSASSKLMFARLAYGAAGSAGSLIDMRDAHAVAVGFVGDGKHNLHWHCELLSLGKDKVKLVLNMVVLALAVLPRGGDITVTVSGNEEQTQFEIVCEGKRARITDGILELLDGTSLEELDSRSIQPYYAGRVAKEARMAIGMKQINEDKVMIIAA